MEKPSTVAHQEFIEGLVGLINRSGLPAFALIPVVEDTMKELRKMADKQYQRDLENWNMSQKEGPDEGTGESEVDGG